MTNTYIERYLNPWRELDRMGQLFNSMTSSGTREYPAVNLWVNGEHAEITTEIPGVDQETMDISVSGNTVTFSGIRTADERTDDEPYYRHEIRHGKFSKTIKLPFNVDSDKVTASYRNGILQISLPQQEADKPRKISIKSE